VAREVKIIVARELEFEVIQRLRGEFPEKTPIFLQPQSNRKWSMNKATKFLRQSLKVGLKNIKVSIQLHKIYGLR
jgi:organic radical activating enzyme